MKQLLFIALLTTIINGCRENQMIPMTTKSYDLLGNIKLLSEKTVKIKLSTDWTYSKDTVSPYCFISNKYFNNNEILDSIHYLDKDSLLISRVLYNYKPNNNGVVSVQYDKLGRKTTETKFISIKDSIVSYEDYNANTKNLLSKTSTKVVNFKTLWMKSDDLKNNLHYEWFYQRDNKGIEIEIKSMFDFGKNKDYRTLKIKYLEWDYKGNWTKRIEYNENKFETDCMLKTRVILYNK